jgi:DNA-binding transcriptional MerR regulator
VEINLERDKVDRLIPPREAAAQFGVSPRSLRRWHALGLIRAKKTMGGQRRYWESEVRARAAELDEAVA